MDDKSKKKKKKLKQKQKQKQQQSVVVNVNLAKSRNKSASERNPQNARVQLPPPIHKVYASPIHDLTPQNFNKDGKQIAQPSLADQMLEKYLQNQEQAKTANVLGSAPQPNISSAQKSTPPRTNTSVSTNKFKKVVKKGRPLGALGKGLSKAEERRQKEEAQQRAEELERENKSQQSVMSLIASEGVSKLKDKSQPPPPQFDRETTSLKNPSTSDDDEQVAAFYESQTYPSNLSNYFQFQPQEEPKSKPENKTKKKSKNNKNLVIKDKEEINEL